MVRISENLGRNSRTSTKSQDSENATTPGENEYSMTKVCKLLSSIKIDLSEVKQDEHLGKLVTDILQNIFD